MLVRVLQTLPGAIGGLPVGENFVAGGEYDVADEIAVVMKREGWAIDAPPPVVAEKPAGKPRTGRQAPEPDVKDVLADLGYGEDASA